MVKSVRSGKLRLKTEARSYTVIEFKFAKIPACVRGLQQQILILGLVLGSSCVLLLSGCSSSMTKGFSGPSGEAVVSGLHGKTHGGQFPVSGSTVQVYAALVGTPAGYAAASTALGSPVTTDSGGNWSYGTFSCASGSDELYVVSSGGNPGLGGNVNNPGLVMTAALGPCSQVDSLPFVFIDEVTTVATSYSLAGFSTDYLHVGTGANNTVGLTNAFATFNNLVNLTTGQANTTTPGYATAPANTTNDTFRSIVPYDLINTLANVLASCVNTDGATNPACSNLFSITGGSQASPSLAVSNTADAALYIAHNPGLTSSVNSSQNNTSALFNLPAPGSPFGPGLSTAPNDYTMTVNFVGGGLGGVKSSSQSGAQVVAIDQQGNLWVPNINTATITELNNLGTPVSASTTINTVPASKPPLALGGFKSGIVAPTNVAIDLNGNAWVSDSQECLVALNSSGAALTGSPYTTVCSHTGANAVAIDASNNVWVETTNSISEADNTGAPIVSVTSGFDTLDAFLGADYTGHMWFIDEGNGHYGALNGNGTLFFESVPGLPYAANNSAAFGMLASGAGGNGGLSMWVPQADGVENLQPILVTGGSSVMNVLPPALLPPTEAGSASIAADGSSNYYFNNDGGANGTNEIPANVTEYTSGGKLLSPHAVGYTGGSALMSLNDPAGIAVDQSGNLWVLNVNNSNNNVGAAAGGTYYGTGTNAANLTEFVGMAAPVNPVYAQDAKNSTYGTKP